MTEQDDLILVQQCLRGDHNAFGVIVDRYQKAILNLAFRMTGNVQDAEDITQSVFVKAFEKLPSYDPRHKLFSWLYRIAVNESLNVVKRRKPTESPDAKLVSTEKPPDEQVHEAQVSGAVQKALLALKPEYRVVVVLRHFNNLSYEEIAKAVGTSVKLVKSRLFTARRLLKDLLIQHGITTNG